ncbi:unnamed protein product [Allacma fusca]|uniref:C2H2-type domain-containing protein n=1 Tax=Allacma fusca TaxID=39272 RepID=A0A8J2K1P1_9HEXA|nr:unnamed protein product [Allacma fusca]
MSCCHCKFCIQLKLQVNVVSRKHSDKNMGTLVLRRGHLTFPRLHPMCKFKLEKSISHVELKVKEIPEKLSKVVSTKRKKEDNKENSVGQVTKKLTNGTSKVTEERLTVISKKKVLPEYEDPRYFCPSCCCYVDASRRRHDQSVHMPPRLTTVRRSPSKMEPLLTIFCDLCEKQCWTQKSLDLHKRRFHDRDKVRKELKGGQLAPKTRLKMKLECFECNSLVPRKSYIEHLKAHDSKEKKADTVNMQGPAKDPRWNGDDAVLQCRHCPSQLFLTWYKYEKHVRSLHPYVPGSKGKKLPIVGN